jgi:hypothetical protein
VKEQREKRIAVARRAGEDRSVVIWRDVEGPHGFAVRNQRRFSCTLLLAHRNRPANEPSAPTLPRPPHPIPRFVTTRDPPLLPGKDGASW